MSFLLPRNLLVPGDASLFLDMISLMPVKTWKVTACAKISRKR